MLRADDRFCGACGAVATTGPQRSGSIPPQRSGSIPPGPPSLGLSPLDTNPWVRIVDRLRAATTGEFEILRELGRGGMAAVYLADEPALARKVAIKVMSPDLLTDEVMVERFKKEAVTVARLHHPNIITIHAVRQVDNVPYFVMNFVEGRSLEHIIHAQGALSIPQMRAIMFQVGSALGYAHRRGTVHRDIKPANILLDVEGNAIVTDFGIAKVAQSPSLTQTGMVFGTPSYISPEQIYGREVTGLADQYSLGIVAFEMLTGRPPFTGSTFTILQSHTVDAVPSITALREDCPEELAAAVARMLAKNPADRWPSLQHALAALGAAPLPEGDPVRAELANLAIPDSSLTPDEVLGGQPKVRTGVSTREPLPYVASVSIVAPPETVEVGDQFSLVASPRSASGSTMPGAAVVWASNDQSVATIDARGLVTAVAPGTTTITASAGDARSAVSVTVTPKRVASVNVSIPPGPLRVGDRIQLVATPQDKRQDVVSRTIHWISTDESIASVSETGVLSARAAGSVLVWAESEGVRGMVRLDVAPAPVASLRITAPASVEADDTFMVTAVPYDAQGNALTDRAISWSSSDTKVASVSQTGVVKARGAGLATLTARAEGQHASAEVIVRPPSVHSLVVSGAPSEIMPGERFSLRAEARDSRGRSLKREITWRSTDTAVAAVSPSGEVELLAPGDVQVIASVDDVEGAVSFSVPAPVMSEELPAPVAPTPPAAAPAAGATSLKSTEILAASPVPPAWSAAAEAAPAAAQRTPVRDVAPSAPPAAPSAPPRRLAETRQLDAAPLAAAASASATVPTSPAKETIAAPAYVPPATPAVAAPPVAPPASRPVVDRAAPARPPAAPSQSRPPLAMIGAGAAVVVVAGGIWLATHRGGGPTTPATNPAADSAAAAVMQPAPPGAPASAAPGSGTPRAPADSTRSVAVSPAPAGGGTPAPLGSASAALVRSVAISGSPHVVVVGDHFSLAAHPLDASSAPLPRAPVHWSTSDPSVATVDSATGAVLARGPGRATITAQSGIAHGVTQLVVEQKTEVARGGTPGTAGTQTTPGGSTPPPVVVARVNAPPTHPMTVGETWSVGASAVDAQGKPVAGQSLAYASDNGAVASVDEYGTVTAKGAGSANITTTAAGRAARTTITVVPKAVANTPGGYETPGGKSGAPETKTGAETKTGGGEPRAEAGPAARAVVDEFVAALRSRDAARISSLYLGESPRDRDNLKSLLDRIKASGDHFGVDDATDVGAPQLAESRASVAFKAKLSWRDPFGRGKSSVVSFQTEYARQGTGWRALGTRITGGI